MISRIPLFLFLVFSCMNVFAQEIIFTDSIFFQELMDQGIDLDGDGKISQIEARKANTVYIHKSDLANADEIRYFTSLDSLTIREANLQSIDLEGLNRLVYLDLSQNNITDFNLPEAPDLSWLNLNLNELTSIDISAYKKLEIASLGHNELTSLELSGLPELWIIHLNSNELSELSLSDLPSLNSLGVSFNQLDSIDVSMLPSLVNLTTFENNISRLDLTGLHRLRTCNCDRNRYEEIIFPEENRIGFYKLNDNLLTSLDIDGRIDHLNVIDNLLDTIKIRQPGGYYFDIFVSGNDSLKYVCAPKEHHELIAERLAEAGLTDVDLNDDCVLTTSVESVAVEPIKFHPNPTMDFIYIDGDFDKVEIHSMDGRLMQSAKAYSNGIDIHQYNSGIYIITGYKQAVKYVSKIVKL